MAARSSEPLQVLSDGFPAGLSREDFPWVWDAESTAQLWRSTKNTNTGEFFLSPLTVNANNNYRIVKSTMALTPSAGRWQWRVKVCGYSSSVGLVGEESSTDEWLGGEFCIESNYSRKTETKRSGKQHSSTETAASLEEVTRNGCWFACSCRSIVQQVQPAFARTMDPGVWELALDCNTGKFSIARLVDSVASELAAPEFGPAPLTAFETLESERYSQVQVFEGLPIEEPLFAVAAGNGIVSEEPSGGSVTLMAVWAPTAGVKSARKR